MSLNSMRMPEIEFVRDKFLKVCEFCHTVKPPRTHHCSQCRRCVARMDHHCIWIGNCVGLHNMKPFLLFLFYAIITCIYSFGLCAAALLQCKIDTDLCMTGDKTFFGILTWLVTAFGLTFTLCMGFLTLAVFVA